MAQLVQVPARRVFITENEVNGLAFPDLPDSIVIFGLGYGVEVLSAVQWLGERELLYWGDIDTYGFHKAQGVPSDGNGERYPPTTFSKPGTLINLLWKSPQPVGNFEDGQE